MNKHKIIYKINYSKFDKNYMYLKGGASLGNDEQGVAMSYRLLYAQPLETGIHLNQDKTLLVVDASGKPHNINNNHHNYNSFINSSPPPRQLQLKYADCVDQAALLS